MENKKDISEIVNNIIAFIQNIDKEKEDLIRLLTALPEDKFELVGKLFYNQKIIICRMPLVDKFNFFNLNHLDAMNTIQLKFIFSLIMEELKKREDK